MKYAVCFTTWLTLMLLYLMIGLILIPRAHLVAYDQAPKDAGARLLNALWWAVPLSWFLAPEVSTVEARFAGAFIFACGAALLIWARRVNPFFLPVLRQPLWIVKDGPYRWIPHPGYFAFVVMANGCWLMLGHWVAAVPLGAYIGYLLVRVQRENRIIYKTRRSYGDANQ